MEENNIPNELNELFDINKMDSLLDRILDMDEEKFDSISQIILESFAQQCMSQEFKLSTANFLNQNGIELEDMITTFEELTDNLNNLEGTYSVKKIEFLQNIIAVLLNSLSENSQVSKRTIIVPIEICGDGIEMPKYAHEGDAAIDLVAAADVDILPGETALIPTGIKIALPKGYCALVQPRSGVSLKSKLRICNTPGLIDSNYRGEIKIIMENVANPIKNIEYEFGENGEIHIKSILHSPVEHIEKGTRIAQLRLCTVPTFNLFRVETLESDTERGEKGFGSSGEK